jgi:RNA polymerase sigma-70 factor, ECF subfamily
MYPANVQGLRSPVERVGTVSHAALPPPRSGAPHDDEAALLGCLRARDEKAFEEILDRWYSSMLRLARLYVRSRDEAEEVVQETWLAVLSGLDRFEGRSSLKSWIYRILVNRARSRGKRESRTVPFSALAVATIPRGGETAFEADRYVNREALGSVSWHGSDWQAPAPDDATYRNEVRALIDDAIDRLPARQQEVITLRDLEGIPARDVCGLLKISEANQRVLLHRARMNVREVLSPRIFDDPVPSACLAQ